MQKGKKKVKLPWAPWRPTRLSRPKNQKRWPFHHRGLECKNRKSRDIWSNRQIWPWTQKEAGQRLICQENTLFQQYKRWLYTWTSPDGQYQNQIDYILCSQRWRSSIQSAKTRLGADCGSDHELLIAKFRLKFNKLGKTIRPFRYFLTEIPNDYTENWEADGISTMLVLKMWEPSRWEINVSAQSESTN